MYLQGPAVRVLRPGWSATLPWPMRPFTRFARRGLEAVGHVSASEKLRQFRSLGGRVYACGPSLSHFGVDPQDLALSDVIVCEYLTFMAIMQEADVQLYPWRDIGAACPTPPADGVCPGSRSRPTMDSGSRARARRRASIGEHGDGSP